MKLQFFRRFGSTVKCLKNSSFAPFHLLSLLFLSFCGTFVSTFDQVPKLASSFRHFPKTTTVTLYAVT